MKDKVMPKRNVILVDTYDDFRDLLPSSGVFEFTDCAVEIWCPLNSDIEEVNRMVHLLESMVHVTDVKIGSEIEDIASGHYRVIMIEDDSSIGRKSFIGER